MKDFQQNKEDLNRELDQFTKILNEMLPRYLMLLRKKKVSDEELSEIGEIEHFLIEVNFKISQIKQMLDEDLFGNTMDIYYKLKLLAKKGDIHAKLKLDKLRENFMETLKQDSLQSWN